MTNLFNQSDIEAATKAIWPLWNEMHGIERAEVLKEMTTALTAATASLEKRGAMYSGRALPEGRGDGPTIVPEEMPDTKKANGFPVAIIRLETADAQE